MTCRVSVVGGRFRGNSEYQVLIPTSQVVAGVIGHSLVFFMSYVSDARSGIWII
jgi:hypothetical protein